MTATTAPIPSTLSANLVCMASMLIWAAGLPAADFIIPLLASEQLTALRMGLAALALLPVWALMEGPAALTRVNWIKGIFVGGLIGLGAWLLIIGQARGGAVTAAVISATLPVVGMAIEILLDGRRVTRGLVLGIILSLAGGLAALDWAGGLSLGLGAVFCFGSVVTFTVGSRLTVTSFPALSPIGRTTLTVTGAAIATGTVALIQVALGSPLPDFTPWGPAEYGALLAFSVGSFAISQLLWIMSVERLGIGLSALHINAAPFYVMVLLFLLGHGWSWVQAGAACLVALGVLIAQGIIGPHSFAKKTS
ncbi:DMT family transporter [Rhodobacter sp. KR11]|jgi:drug/metabolite transporter (DMT)-like permease|uniref:DMT family transporter n=1 Tax=Rhodobacter sp. KR11 TaxID=2974588 RepID=UPI0022213464|nr:DMT family transporter [Rhodobacter sp. KR11]MCW1917701.1 DMT family transporter [Rhodobacter sp. KR11]